MLQELPTSSPGFVVPIQLPTNVPGKQQLMLNHLNSCHPCGKPGWSPGFLALVCHSPGCCGHLGNKATDGKSFSQSHLLLLFSCNLPFKIHILGEKSITFTLSFMAIRSMLLVLSYGLVPCVRAGDEVGWGTEGMSSGTR